MESAPIAQEVEDHMATHMPFRSWCPYCVASKAVSDPHRKKDGLGTVPIVSLDYAFMGAGDDASDSGQIPIIVIEDDTSNAVFAHMVPRKCYDEHSISRIAQDVRSLGYRRIILKSDQ